MALIRPSQIAVTIYDIDGEALRQAGIKGLILNWHNTVAKKNKEYLSDSLVTWLKEFKAKYGMKFIIVSNGSPPKSNNDSELLNEIPALFEAGKPLKKAFLSAANQLGTRVEETAVIGNGLISEIWGGNRLGMYTIFVSPLWAKPRILGTFRRLIVKALKMTSRKKEPTL